MELGTPTLQVIGPSVTIRPIEIDKDGNEVQIIKTSSTGDIPTNVKFPEPIFLAPGREYAIVLISENSDAYEVWTAVMGEKTVNTTTLPDVDAVIYTQQFALGSLFKSQNGSIWTTDQFQDLKFKLYKAEFTETTGTAYFYNPPLNETNGYNQSLPINPISAAPRSGWIGIQTISDEVTAGILTVGRRLAGYGDYGGSAIITGVGGTATGINTVSGGQNYTPSITNFNIAPTNLVGLGTGLVLQVSTSGLGTITNVSIAETSPGFGYRGDLVTIVGTELTTNSTPGTGKNAQISVTGIGSANRLYVSNVQGQFNSSFPVGAAVSYYNTSNLNSIVSLGSTEITDFTELNTGKQLFIRHFDHGMYSSTNKVKIYNVSSDVPVSKLDATLQSSETATLVLTADSSDFNTFEGLSVGTDNTGYLKIGSEIIGYDNVNGTTISISARGVDNTKAETHELGSTIEKYEFNGVSLRRINGITTSIQGPIDIDGYYLDIDMSDNNGSKLRNADFNDNTQAYPSLAFNSNNSGGGDNVYATENILYTGLRPTYDIETPSSSTFVNGRVRTVSGSSVASNSQTSFIDKGYQTIQLNTYNSLTDPRLICSEVNQDEYLTGLPRKKSFTTAINFNTSNKMFLLFLI